ncbi:MAG: transporter [Deltaproteobacteria bacterium]|nr:transporter [Deltaproteobacteria bacterium]
MARLPLLAGAPLLCLSLLLQEASGGGYAIPHQSARAVGLANAVTAGVADPSAVYVNPAALTEIEGNRILAGVNYIHVVSSIGNSGRTSVNRHDDNFIPTFFANYHLPATDLTAGIGLYAPYGLAASYDENSFTRFGAVRSELRTMYLTPAISWRMNPSLSVGGGLSFVHSSALFARSLFLGGGAEGKVRLTDTDNGYGYNVGLLYKPVERIKLGLTYRSRVDLNFDTALAKVADATGAISTARSKGTQIPLPPVISMGLNWQITPDWAAEFVYDYTHWSEFRHLKARFTPALLGGGLGGLFIQSLWKDASILRLGASYRATENLELRAGVTVDETPIPARTLSPSIPGADLLTLNAGLGYRWGSVGVDLAYMAVFYMKRSVLNDVLEAGNSANTVAPGRDKYEIFHNFVSLHLTYRF